MSSDSLHVVSLNELKEDALMLWLYIQSLFEGEYLASSGDGETGAYN